MCDQSCAAVATPSSEHLPAPKRGQVTGHCPPPPPPPPQHLAVTHLVHCLLGQMGQHYFNLGSRKWLLPTCNHARQRSVMSPAGKHSCAPHTFRPQRAWLPSSERGAPWGCAEAAAARLTFLGYGHVVDKRGSIPGPRWLFQAVCSCACIHVCLLVRTRGGATL